MAGLAIVGTVGAVESTPLLGGGAAAAAPAVAWTGAQIAGGTVALLSALGLGGAIVEKAREDANEDPNQTPYVEPTPEYEPAKQVTHRRRKSPTGNSSANQLGEDFADIATTAFDNTPLGSVASNALDTADEAHNRVEQMENIRDDMKNKGIKDALLDVQEEQAELTEKTIENAAEAPFDAVKLAAETAVDAMNALNNPVGALNGVLGGFEGKLETNLDKVGDTVENTRGDISKITSALIDDNAALIDNNAKLIDNLIKYGKITHLIYLDRPKREKPTIEGLVYI
jgi:hypothetical protein